MGLSSLSKVKQLINRPRFKLRPSGSRASSYSLPFIFSVHPSENKMTNQWHSQVAPPWWSFLWCLFSPYVSKAADKCLQRHHEWKEINGTTYFQYPDSWNDKHLSIIALIYFFSFWQILSHSTPCLMGSGTKPSPPELSGGQHNLIAGINKLSSDDPGRAQRPPQISSGAGGGQEQTV